MKYRQVLSHGVITILVLLFGISEGLAQTQAGKLAIDAVQFEKEGKYEDAVSVYLRILEIHPNSASIYNNLGADYFALRKYDEAIAALNRSIALDPRYGKAYYNLGVAYSHLNRYAEAVSVLQGAVKIDPTHIEARIKLCDTYLASEQNGNAVGCYEKLLPLVREDGQSHSNYGVALMRTRRLKEATRVFEDAVRRFSPNFETLNNLGVALLEIGRYKEAANAFNRAIEIEPKDTAARYNLAIAQLAAKNNAGALEQYAFLKRENVELAQRLFGRIYSGRIISARDK